MRRRMMLFVACLFTALWGSVTQKAAAAERLPATLQVLESIPRECQTFYYANIFSPQGGSYVVTMLEDAVYVGYAWPDSKLGLRFMTVWMCYVREGSAEECLGNVPCRVGETISGVVNTRPSSFGSDPYIFRE